MSIQTFVTSKHAQITKEDDWFGIFFITFSNKSSHHDLIMGLE